MTDEDAPEVKDEADAVSPGVTAMLAEREQLAAWRGAEADRPPISRRMAVLTCRLEADACRQLFDEKARDLEAIWTYLEERNHHLVDLGEEPLVWMTRARSALRPLLLEGRLWLPDLGSGADAESIQ